MVLAIGSGRHQPTGAGFDLLLLGHVASAIVAFLSIVVSGVEAARLLGRSGAVVPASLVRYYAPGVNWVARAIYGVPIFGFALLADSRGAFDLSDGWVLAGLFVWVGVAAIGECALWPAERRVQQALRGPSDERCLRRQAVRICVVASGLAAALLGATVVMVAQP
jgi:hypothetical protein